MLTRQEQGCAFWAQQKRTCKQKILKFILLIDFYYTSYVETDALGLAQGNCADTSFTFPADGQFILLLPLYLRLHSIILFFILLQIFTLPFLIHNSF